MPSVGALTVSVKAETAALQQGLDQAKTKVGEFEAGVRGASDRVRSAFARIGLGAESMKRAFANVAGGILLAQSSAEGMDKKVQALTQTFGALLTGGPIAAGIVGLTSAFRLLAEETENAGEAAQAARSRFEEMIEGIRSSTHKAMDELRGLLEARGALAAGLSVEDYRRFRGVGDSKDALAANEAALQKAVELHRKALSDLGGRMTSAQRDVLIEQVQVLAEEIRGREKVAEELRKELALRTSVVNMAREDAELAKEKANALTAANEAFEAEIAKAERFMKAEDEYLKSRLNSILGSSRVGGVLDFEADRVERRRQAMEEWVREYEKLEEAQRRVDETVADILHKYEQMAAGAAAVTDEERDRLAVLEDVRRAFESGASWAQAEAIFDAGMKARTAARAAEVGRDAAKALADAMREELERRMAFWVDIGRTISGTLTAAIVDGITNGSRQMQDIFRNAVNAMLAATIQSILASGIQMIFGALVGGLGPVGGVLSGIAGVAPAIAGAAPDT